MIKNKINSYLNKYLILSANNKLLSTNFISSVKITLSISVTLLILHLTKSFNVSVQNWVNEHPFQWSNFSFISLMTAPLFHNNHYHFIGDILSFFIFSYLCEVYFSKTIYFILLSFGLWFSNLSSILFIFLVSTVSQQPELWLQVIHNQDYGSSNAIYSFVGGLAALLKHPKILLFPFFLNGLLLVATKNNLLSWHHLISLFFGYFFVLIVLYRRKYK